MLVGGSDHTVTFQPISIAGSGLNLAMVLQPFVSGFRHNSEGFLTGREGFPDLGRSDLSLESVTELYANYRSQRAPVARYRKGSFRIPEEN